MQGPERAPASETLSPSSNATSPKFTKVSFSLHHVVTMEVLSSGVFGHREVRIREFTKFSFSLNHVVTMGVLSSVRAEKKGR